jgi:hypothetical protein
MKTLLLIITGLVYLSGCTQITRLDSTRDFDRLPISRGVYTRSLLVEKWQYGASSDEYHFFLYQFTLNNSIQRRGVAIKRGLVAMPFERLIKDEDTQRLTAMEPIIRNGRVVAFKTKPERHPTPKLPR